MPCHASLCVPTFLVLPWSVECKWNASCMVAWMVELLLHTLAWHASGIQCCQLQAKMEAERQRAEVERQRMKAERQRMEAERLQMFEYMRGVYAAIGQPPPPMPVPPPQPALNTVSGTVSHFTTL